MLYLISMDKLTKARRNFQFTTTTSLEQEEIINESGLQMLLSMD